MSITTDCGWLSPEGRWYPCPEEGHRDLAEQIVRGQNREIWSGFQLELERQGWIKLVPLGTAMGIPVGGVYYGTKSGGRVSATPRQNRALLDWCLGKGHGRTPLPHWLQPDAGPEAGAL